MPAIELRTNVKIDNLEQYMKELSKLSATTLGKPEEYICVSILQGIPMTFAGTSAPAFLLNVTSLGNINPAANIQYSKVFFEHFHKTLKVDNDRGYIVFIDPGQSHIGYKDTTFEVLWGDN